MEEPEADYEYDAPRFYNFRRKSSLGNSNASQWFDLHEGHPSGAFSLTVAAACLCACSEDPRAELTGKGPMHHSSCMRVQWGRGLLYQSCCPWQAMASQPPTRRPG
jgi:hypothetical protein